MSHLAPIAVVGPTGSGKSALGLVLAEQLGGHIINCDAMQQYRGMDIGTAKTPVAQRRGIPHHQIDVLDVTETATVSRYQESASQDIEMLLAQNITPIIVGGSMLYVQSLLDGWCFPPTDSQVRARWEADVANYGSEALHAVLAECDPQAARTILPTDSRRIVRALEVITLTGKPFAATQPTCPDAPRWGTRIVGLGVDVDWLDPLLHSRTETMFSLGLVDEAASLCDVGLRDGVTASHAIGYSQALQVVDGEISVEEAVELTYMATRRYVRRQRSWFRRDDRINWCRASSRTLVEDVYGVLQLP